MTQITASGTSFRHACPPSLSLSLWSKTSSRSRVLEQHLWPWVFLAGFRYVDPFKTMRPYWPDKALQQSQQAATFFSSLLSSPDPETLDQDREHTVGSRTEHLVSSGRWHLNPGCVCVGTGILLNTIASAVPVWLPSPGAGCQGDSTFRLKVLRGEGETSRNG